MQRVLASVILFCSALCRSKVASAVTPAPRNVRITSFNMDLVLRWDPPDGATGDLVYRAEFTSSVGKFNTGCVNISARSCDFTSAKVSSVLISVYGTYRGRVRAETDLEHSIWVESEPIALCDNTTIGPPTVSLIPHGNNMEVSITDPVFKMSSLRRTYSYATYSITYWKEGQREKASNEMVVEQNRAVANDLEPWTTYCFQTTVQIHTHLSRRVSQPSELSCQRTSNGEEAPWLVAVVMFIVIVMVATMAVLIGVYHKKISLLLCPKESLPVHLKEYLLELPRSSVILAMQTSQPLEEHCDQITGITNMETEGEELLLQAGGENCNTQPDYLKEEPANGNVLENDRTDVQTGGRGSQE